MKRIKALAFFAAIAIGSINAVHGQQYFKSFGGQNAPSSGKQLIVPDKYKIFSADNRDLQSFLHGIKQGPGKDQTLQLPDPDGNYVTFRLWRNALVPPVLQAKYAIETFTAEAAGNSKVTAKIDFTANGFHAMVFNGSQTYFIDPYTDASDGYYIVYYKNDYHRSLSNRMVCEFGRNEEVLDANGNHPEQIDGTLPPLAAKQFGTLQRTYKLALSCTGEYAQAVGGATPTKSTVLSAMTTSMNRVNGIYEREFSISMEFIDNEDTLIYLDPNTDPFTGNSNNSGPQLLTLNQNNTQSIIGNANYDIGHIFSTGGGGIAFLGCVCANNIKARGVTGSDNPVGDAYDVDYVAHEMGHQFGAEHTFNSNQGACQGNGEQSSAFETGSGTTIMAYAGICGNDDIQPHSDAYFHARSLDQISDFVTTTTCAVTTAGVSAPELAEIADTFFIPIGTPFELISPLAATDSTDTISYCWEEWNLGNFGSSENNAATFTAGPCYRSFAPVGEPVRVFPPIEKVISGNLSAKGMRMPSVSRPLDFKVTARSIYEGWGTFNISDDKVHVNVIDSAGPFVVTFPSSATDSVERGTNATVTWNVAGTDFEPVNAAGVDIFLSIDGGFTYPFVLATNVPNDGSETVILPDTATVKARVKVKGAGNIFFNISQTNFKIYDTADSGLGLREVTLYNGVSVYPNPAKDLISVENTTGAVLDLNLFNVLGQKIWSGKMTQNTTIPAGAFSRGVYYLQLNDERSGVKAVRPISLR